MPILSPYECLEIVNDPLHQTSSWSEEAADALAYVLAFSQGSTHDPRSLGGALQRAHLVGKVEIGLVVQLFGVEISATLGQLLSEVEADAEDVFAALREKASQDRSIPGALAEGFWGLRDLLVLEGSAAMAEPPSSDVLLFALSCQEEVLSALPQVLLHEGSEAGERILWEAVSAGEECGLERVGSLFLSMLAAKRVSELAHEVYREWGGERERGR